MKYTSFLFALFVGSLSFAQSTSPVGQWRTIDDDTKKPKSIVEIWQDGGTLRGKVAELINPTEPNPLCKECKGDKKDQPIKGMEILWDLKEKEAGVEWAGGQIMDPKNGKTYKCKMHLVDNGNKLEVRGFIGFSLLGRTQVWERVK